MFTRHKMKENALAFSLIASLHAEQQDSNACQTKEVSVQDALCLLGQLSARRHFNSEDSLH